MKRKSVRDKDDDDDTITTVSRSRSRREVVAEIAVKARSRLRDVVKEVIALLSRRDFNYEMMNATHQRRN